MPKVGSLPDSMKRRYEWQCKSCNLAFTDQAPGLRCTRCGGTLQRVHSPELSKELWEMELGN